MPASPADRLIDLRKLETFVCVAEQLSFRRAATLMHLDQSAITRHVQALERDLGVALLERSHRRVTLTEAGRDFLRDARELLVLCLSAVDRVRTAAASAGSP